MSVQRPKTVVSHVKWDVRMAPESRHGSATFHALAGAERLEGDDGMGVLDAGNHLYLLVDEMADVGVIVDVEFDQQIVVARGGIDLRADPWLRDGVGDATS